MRKILSVISVVLIVGCAATETEPVPQVQEAATEPLVVNCNHVVTLTIEKDMQGNPKITPDLDPVPNVQNPDKLCWTVDNKMDVEIWVELADFKHEQFAKEEPSGKYIDPLHDAQGNDDGEKRGKAQKGKGENVELIKTKVRRMQKYKGCYKYTVFVLKADETPWGSLDPRLEYDGGGVDDQNLCEGTTLGN